MIAAKETGKFDNQLFLQFLIARRYKVYRHLTLLLVIVSGLYYGEKVFEEPYDTYVKLGIFSWLLLIVYINMYTLIPNLLFKERYFEYVIGLLLVLGVSLLFFAVLRYFVIPGLKPISKSTPPPANVFAFTFMFTILNAASATIKLFQRWITDSQRINELETTTMQAELEQLKNQINPHFLFNTLNNVNVLTQKDPEKASQVLMKLSDLLRYQLYDSTRNKVVLTADIRFLEDFLNLEKIRRDNFEFTITTAGDLSGVQVSPLLFITFAENAVKHNMDAEKSSYVHLFFNLEHNNLHFKCINSKPDPPVLKNSGGLGLANVKRRLELLYHNKHTLTIIDKNDTFQADLTIKL